MQDFPHHYSAFARAQEQGEIELGGDGLAPLQSAPPAEFGGPGDLWSPETLLVAAVADCFALTFRAIARASKLPRWPSTAAQNAPKPSIEPTARPPAL